MAKIAVFPAEPAKIEIGIGKKEVRRVPLIPKILPAIEAFSIL
jgi:hypothetical protein